MTSQDVQSLTNAIIAGESVYVKDLLNTTIMNKILDKFEDKKVELAQSMFSQNEDD